MSARPRILYIDIDSARADHFGCYGYHRNTTPSIDQIAADGVRFTNCYVSDSPCNPSRTALFTGRFGAVTGAVNHGGRWADVQPEGPGRGFQSTLARESFASMLRATGIRCCSVSPFAFRHSAYQMLYGFHEMHDTGGAGYETADEVYAVAARWLESNGHDDGWFLHVNFWDAHGPYDTDLAYGNPFADEPPPAWLTQEIIDAQRLSYSPNDAVTPRGISGAVDDWPRGWPRGPQTIANTADWKDWIDAYDTGLRFADDYVGRIVDLLKRLGVYNDTVIIVSADHGENQGELNVYGDHQTADHCTNNVPFIIRWPDVTNAMAGRSSDALVYQLDLLPTVAELVNGTPGDGWDGESFAAALRGQQFGGRSHLVVSQGAWSCQRSVRWNKFLLIRTYDTGHKDVPDIMLFDIDADPHETTNLARAKPETVAEGLALLDGWVTRVLTEQGRADPLAGVIAEGGPWHAQSPARICARLRETSRDEHAAWLEENGGRPRSVIAT